LELGWRREDIEVIDTDLGLTGANASHRVGFQQLVARVTLGQVGIILSVDVTRLSRNCSDWYPLLDVCGYRGCLIADRGGIYDPGSANGRLLLGLKGQLSELELHTIRARMTTGLLNKAQRGELALSLPIGLVRDGVGKVHKDPNRDLQDRLDLLFTTFLRLRSVSKVLQFLNTHNLCLPRRDRFGDVVWKKPTVAAILQILKNPAYAGAFVYGKTRSMRKDPSSPHTQEVRLPMDQWKIRVNDVYPAYISWETFEQIQKMLADNYAAYDRNKSRGGPRDGAALLHGIVYCGECGHKMVMEYKHGTRYHCNYLRQQYRVPVCQDIPADPVDLQVVESFFQSNLMSMRLQSPPNKPPLSTLLMLISSIWNDCAIKLLWPSGSSIGLIPTIVWSLLNWKSDGKPRCSISKRQKRHRPRRVLPRRTCQLSVLSWRRPFAPLGSICRPSGDKDESVSATKKLSYGR
jgi:DNA invertase Pin-like site-specific DNA recombinase